MSIHYLNKISELSYPGGQQLPNRSSNERITAGEILLKALLTAYSAFLNSYPRSTMTDIKQLDQQQ
jgi:hypothetical protein